MVTLAEARYVFRCRVTLPWADVVVPSAVRRLFALGIFTLSSLRSLATVALPATGTVIRIRSLLGRMPTRDKYPAEHWDYCEEPFRCAPFAATVSMSCAASGTATPARRASASRSFTATASGTRPSVSSTTYTGGSRYR